MSTTWSGIGMGSCFLARRTSECAPQPWLKATTRPSSLASPLAQTPKVCASGPARRIMKPHVEQESGEPWARGESGPPRPSYHRSAAASRPSGERVRTRPRPRSLATCAHLRLVVGVERVVAEGVGGHQARVVVVDREQVARGQVTGLDALAVGHPRGRHDGVVTGEQDDLADRDLLLARGPGHDHRPAPAGVAAHGGGEEVGHDPLVLGLDAEVVADLVGRDLLEQGRARHVDGGGRNRVGLLAKLSGGAHRPQHGSSRRSMSGRGRVRPVAGGASGQDGSMTSGRPDHRPPPGGGGRDEPSYDDAGTTRADAPGAGERAGPGGRPGPRHRRARDRPRRACHRPGDRPVRSGSPAAVQRAARRQRPGGRGLRSEPAHLPPRRQRGR